MDLKKLIEVAAGREPADLVLKNGRVVNVFTEEILEGDVAIVGDRIAGVGAYEGRETIELDGRHVAPGFIDAHVHIESSLLSVPEFANLVAAHGTAAVITDPHEIANVMGIEGIRYMLDSARHCPVRVYVMLSSCVPASHLESAGANLSANDLRPLLDDPSVLGLAEMMNFPGVVNGDDGVLDKLRLCAERVIDGHSPGLTGRDLQAYVAAGIGSDHECTTLEEAREKLRTGQHIMIREGSQARNLETLLPLVTPETSHRFMFVTDDKDVEDLLAEGHIDHVVRKAIACGLEPTTAIRMASINAARYFGLRQFGAVAPGYVASLAILDDLRECRVSKVFAEGRLVAEEGRVNAAGQMRSKVPVPPSSVMVGELGPEQFVVRGAQSGREIGLELLLVAGEVAFDERRLEHDLLQQGGILVELLAVDLAGDHRHLAVGGDVDRGRHRVKEIDELRVVALPGAGLADHQTGERRQALLAGGVVDRAGVEHEAHRDQR